jgi:hypothetical protein
MKKEDLKSGMIVEDRIGNLGMVLLNTTDGDIIGGGTDDFTDGERIWRPLENVKDDLTGREKASDIVKIYNGASNYHFGTFNTEVLNCIWERLEPIEMTIGEIATKLGIDANRLKIIK